MHLTTSHPPSLDMVTRQIISRGIDNGDVLRAMARVPREKFVPTAFEFLAYDDRPLPIGDGQTVSQPYIVALMTTLSRIDGNSRVLEVGTGSGYQTAVLAEIAKDVFTVERIPTLSMGAQDILAKLGYSNIRFRIGDGAMGWETEAPFDAIVVTAAPPEIPQKLKEQLVVGGKLVIPVGDLWVQELKVLTKLEDGSFETENITEVMFVPLVSNNGREQGLIH